MTVDRREFANRKDLIDKLSRAIAERLERRIEATGSASMVVSGGSTPKLLFRKLCTEKLAWDKVVLTVSDERLVPATHDASNEKMVRDGLLQEQATDAAFVRLISSEPKPADAERVVESRLETIPRPFAVTLLGMGSDGHFASLFPGDPYLERGLDMDSDRQVKAVVLPDPPAEAPFPRMTMTLPALVDTDLIALLIMGDQKLETLNKALSGDDAKEMPVRALFRQPKTNVEIFWAP